jgi:hypothetical protein
VSCRKQYIITFGRHSHTEQGDYSFVSTTFPADKSLSVEGSLEISVKKLYFNITITIAVKKDKQLQNWWAPTLETLQVLILSPVSMNV